MLATDQTQVVLTRRLNRNGASDFLINKKPVRLKDITDLMMDSGLGKDSFALISQGKVEQIFNEKPEETSNDYRRSGWSIKNTKTAKIKRNVN